MIFAVKSEIKFRIFQTVATDALRGLQNRQFYAEIDATLMRKISVINRVQPNHLFRGSPQM
jgi:hypothetical protein